MNLTELLPFGASILIGALIGIERERHKQNNGHKSSVGLRTSILMSLLGAVSAYLGQNYHQLIFILTLGAVLLLVILSHHYLITKYGRIGLTSEFSSLLIFIFGAMCTLGHMQIAIMLAIITTLVLTTRNSLHKFVKKIQTQELYDTLKFAIIAFIILPFLPNIAFDQQILAPFLPQSSALNAAFTSVDVLNPYRIWLLIVFVSGISFLGYIMVKIFGNKVGISLTGLMGGLYSSTATSLTLAAKSKTQPKVKTPFIAGIILALTASYSKSFLFLFALNAQLFHRSLIPLGIMFAYMCAIALYYCIKSEKKPTTTKTQKLESPFQLKKAMKLGIFIVAALLAAKISLAWAGVELYYIVAAISAFFAIDDPIVISTATTAGTLISMDDAKNIILLVTYLNMAQKAGIVYLFGNKKLVKPLLIIFAGLLLVTIPGFLYF